ncbi:peptidoglycan DD-metalloendopeptidase family protein [Halomonas sp. GXIMD04776]|uniref:peptidoglycan DD-metalloendopeptidase family protein n=1 Tax=Halomonas sp. GXIMD04776 TaxID=3415605 RepID=UPI003CAABF6F
MRKALLVTALALGVAGCGTPNTSPDVRDLSVSRETQAGESVTVQEGDTLYGIAWRQNMDFRDLARLNGITPPYRLQPGQTLQLGGAGQGGQAASGGAAAASDPNLAQNDMTAGAAGAAGVSGTQAPDWLAPDTEAIERNRRLTSRPLESSSERSASQQAPSSQPSSSAPSSTQADAEQAQGTRGQGPIYNYGSPGADGQLSAQDRAEREALARQRAQAQSQPQSQPSARENASARDESTQSAQPRGSNQQPPNQGAQQNNQAARQPGNAAAQEEATVAGPAADAGTAVAGGADAPSAQQRTYTPVENVSWQWPAEGQLVGRFSDGSSITAGIDIAGQKGQPVKAAGPGIVVYAGDGVRGYGNLILLKHNDSFLSAYAYNDSLKVRENDVVEAGQVIATMGDTDADGVKLHFEVRQDGQPRDPLEFLPQR